MPCGICGEWGHNKTTCPNKYSRSDEESDDASYEEESTDASIEALADALSHVRVKDDIHMYNQLQHSHSKTITGFRSRSSCWDCFIEEYSLDRDVVRNLYTKNKFFHKLNVSLCQNSNDSFVKMYTQLLAESIYNVCERRLPDVVYRGTSFSDGLGRLYKRNIGAVIYFYNFTSTSRSKTIAKGFAGENGWLLEIRLPKGNRDCVADVSIFSDYPHEEEVLISANAGYQICEVDQTHKIIVLELKDESKCLKCRPEKACGNHKRDYQSSSRRVPVNVSW